MRISDWSSDVCSSDLGSIDADGFLLITDRAKDVIKSGGEWIGSIELENLACAHPAVAQAAVIGVAHPKWDERPLLIIVAKPGVTPTREELLARSEERRVGKECVSKCRSRWSPYH